MLYSKLFGKTQREPQKDMQKASHKYLYQAGFVRESVAGRYYFLPLGMRVRKKVMDIIREEMDRSGSQEMLSPTLHPIELWQESNRTTTTGFEITTVKDRRGGIFALGGTAEEMFVDIIRKYNLSYKELPINVYQFSTKFRDELRARGGLLRVREFTMKDAYSFDLDEEGFKKEYQNMWDTYTRIFERMGLKTYVVPAAVGYMGGSQSHEFVVESDAGESNFFVTDDGKYIAHEDIAEFTREEINPNEEEKDFEIIDQPEWVKTMEDNEKHYKLPPSRFLKNVVYQNTTNGEVIIAVMRGDLEVNKSKLESVLDAVGQLEDAPEEVLYKLGSQPGYVHCWGHEHKDGNKVRYIGDISLKTVKNFIGGQKEETTDSINVNYGRDFKCEILADIAVAKEGYIGPDGKSRLVAKKGIEVGNLFNLGYHYSHKMKDSGYINSAGEMSPYYMGSYGIGIGRTIASIVEVYHDEKGIVWPKNVSPYNAHLIGLNMEDEKVSKRAYEVYETLKNAGIEILFDDRDTATAGEKLADADLIGIPYRVIVSKKTGDKIELKKRNESKTELLDLKKLIDIIGHNYS